MTLTDLLSCRSQFVKDIQVLEGRILQGQSYSEQVVDGQVISGDRPYTEEDLRTMIADMEAIREELLLTKRQIAEANQKSGVQNLIIKRGEVKATIDFWKRLRGESGRDRYSYRNDLEKKVIPVKEADAKVDELVKQIRKIDSEIRRLNDTTEV